MTPLPTRPFGTTGLSFPILSMGCGFPFNFAGFDTAVAAVRHAAALGIRYFDTSPLYRSGASQAILGEALSGPGMPADLFIATKVGHFREARFFRSTEALHVQLHENLRLLRRDSVDLLQIHEADWDNWWTDRPDVAPCELFDLQKPHNFNDAPVLQFLREAKARGLCKYIGITGNNARHLTRLVRQLEGIDSVLVAYNFMPLNASCRDDLIPAAAEKGLALLVAGLFTFIHRIPDGWRTEGTYFGHHADTQLAALQTLQRASGIPMEELTLRWTAAAAPRVSTILLGACTPAQVEQNLAALRMGPLPRELHVAVEKIAAQFAQMRP